MKTLIALWALLFIVPIAFGAEPKSIDDLLKDRAAVREALTAMTKTLQENYEEFTKIQAVKDFNAKQGKLQQAAAESDRRLKELDSLIAERVAKEREGKK